jgi:hypothetical protein
MVSVLACVIVTVVVVVVVDVGIVKVDANGSCPWRCFCDMLEPSGTVNCSGLSFDKFPTDLATEVSMPTSVCTTRYMS